MAKKKKKHQGHYCKICSEYKANEKFSGKGHALHICKACMSKKGKTDNVNPEKIVVDDDFFDIVPEDMDYDMFNPDLDIMPREFLEPIKYKKLDKVTKTAIKTLWGDIVGQYWEANHQIPYGESFMKLRKELIDILADQGDMALSDDKDLKAVLSDNIIIIINKILKQEKRT